jgi:glutathione-regulated potassium-efflux system ancillary protein KefF
MPSVDLSVTPSMAGPVSNADVLVLLAHPSIEQSRVNRRLVQAIRQAFELAGSSRDGARVVGATNRIAVRNLYALYPDYLIDAAAEQVCLAKARLVVWLHPIHWYGMPPLMKLWLDEVLAFGWAYGPGGHSLQGKDLWLVASTGSPEEAYHPSGHNRYFFDAFLPPYEQTAALCGMRFVEPLMLHGAHRVDDAALDAHAAMLVARLMSYPDWPELAESADCIDCAVPALARPAR